MVERTIKVKLTVKKYWKEFTIKDVLCFIKESWEKVPRNNRVWKNLCPELVHDFIGFDIQEKVLEIHLECVAKVRKAGFKQTEEKDIAELIGSHRVELSNEELLEREKIETAELEASKAWSASQC